MWRDTDTGSQYLSQSAPPYFVSGECETPCTNCGTIHTGIVTVDGEPILSVATIHGPVADLVQTVIANAVETIAEEYARRVTALEQEWKEL